MQPVSVRFSPNRETAPDLHYLAWGNEHDPLLVLLHGGGSNAHWWDHMAPALARRFRVVALDFRGHGVSEYPEQLVVGAFNDDLELLLEHLGTEAAILIGHSMGSHVAVDHASRHPATRALALIDIARGSTKNARRRSRLALRIRGSYARREDAVDRFQFLPESSSASEALRVSIAEHSVRQLDSGRFSYRFDPRWFTLPPRPAPDLSRIECPVLIVRGAQSTILSEEGATRFAGQLANARVEVIEGAGHHVHLDRPKDTLAALESFLATVDL
ncbi:MAG: alpha/beta hydrolase [bacterium]|nr:alpha/beta hydrolase [bacterium]